MKDKKGLNKGMILYFGLISMVFATGILFFVMTFLRIDIASWGLGSFMAALLSLSTLSWVILLCRNC